MKRKNYNLMIGGAITLFFLAVALIGQFWTPYGTCLLYTSVDSVEVQDDKTLVVNLKESYSEFLPMMTIAIIPKSNEDPAGNPIGTGPFKYVSYTPGQNLELEKYDGYWQEMCIRDRITSLRTIRAKLGIKRIPSARMML